MKIATNLLIALFVCTSVKTGHAQRSRSTSPSAQNKNRRSNCGLTRFQCKDGQCIPSWELCDGTAHCRDRSDETEEECRQPSITCSAYAFRCAYGACVDGDAPCNGVQDCLDNSDETLPRCSRSTSTGNETSRNSPCRADEFACKNDQCIDRVNVCDGPAHCSDRSDETVAECGNISCPQTVFRCAYGACIDGDLRCNGVVNCADGSDEDPRLCRDATPSPSTSTERSYPGPTTTTTSTTTSRPDQWSDRPSFRSCRVPQQPINGQWRLHRSQCQTNDHCAPRSGLSEFAPGTRLVYNCNRGYTIDGAVEAYCSLDGRWSSTPVCAQIKCRPLSTASTDALCTYNNEWTSCESPVLPQTTAKLTCRNSYRQDTSLLTQRDQVRCNERGQWEPEPIRCVPVCGVVSTNAVPLIVNGTRPNITEFPWHATLYRAESSSEPKEFICGATIIQDKLLITAAHCIYDEANQRIDEPQKFYVATGNYFRDYDSPLHDKRIVKKGRVKNIYIICNYLGIEGNYAWDIAILELETPFVFSSFLVPICVDPSTFGDQTALESGSQGKVAGFGRTAMGASSFILQAITVPYIPINQCRSASSSSENERFITIDKFCAGYTNGSSVCDGDSGGGLVFKTGGLWYLRGIVSVGIGSTSEGGTRKCNSHSYSLYTRISNHISWIQDVLLKLDTYGSVPSCPAS